MVYTFHCNQTLNKYLFFNLQLQLSMLLIQIFPEKNNNIHSKNLLLIKKY